MSKRKLKTINSITDAGLDAYNTKTYEPRNSVTGSSDYEFATTRYSKDDFRYTFTSKYMEFVKRVYDTEIANCKFERPRHDSNFINFYIYLWDDEFNLRHRIEDKSSYLIISFYKTLKKHKLPAITEKTRVQFLVKNIKHVMKSRCLDLAWHDIHNEIKEVFREVADLSYWDDFYVFIDKDLFEQIVENTEYLERIRNYCYNAAKKHDTHHILSYQDFHIRIDNFQKYSSIGGYNYFNSDYMHECLKI